MNDTVSSKVRSQCPGLAEGLALFAITWLFMMWPLIVNQVPFYSEDSPSYLRGGEFGFKTGLMMISQWWEAVFETGGASFVQHDGETAGSLISAALGKAGGTRSPIYSVTSYILRAPGGTLSLLAVAQAAAVAFVVSLALRSIAPAASFWLAVPTALGIALLTSAAWYAAYATPDILAGVAILGSILLTAQIEKIGWLARCALVLLIAFSMTAHASHMLLTGLVLAVGGLLYWWSARPGLAALAQRAIWCSAPVFLAVSGSLTISWLAFGELSLAPKRYPISLARAVADGPAAWHLRDNCAAKRYAICEIFGPYPPRDVSQFLWGPDGVRYQATPDQMERIRVEESLIIRRATMEYPVHQARRAITNSLAQSVEFGLSALRFDRAMIGEHDPVLVRVKPDIPMLRGIGEAAIYFSLLVSLLCLFVFRSRLTRIEAQISSLAIMGLLANAAICGTLSAVTDRYQGRVVWVLPALVAAFLVRILSQRTGPSARSRPVQK